MPLIAYEALHCRCRTISCEGAGRKQQKNPIFITTFSPSPKYRLRSPLPTSKDISNQKSIQGCLLSEKISFQMVGLLHLRLPKMTRVEFCTISSDNQVLCSLDSQSAPAFHLLPYQYPSPFPFDIPLVPLDLVSQLWLQLEGGEELARQFTTLIHFDHQSQFSQIRIDRYWGIRFADWLSIDFCTYADVLTSRKTKHRILGREFET